MEVREHMQANLQKLREQLDSGRMRSARVMVNSLHPSEIARLLESLPRNERALLWEIVDADQEGDVLVDVADEVRDDLIKDMQTDRLIAATEGMEVVMRSRDDRVALARTVVDFAETLAR